MGKSIIIDYYITDEDIEVLESLDKERELWLARDKDGWLYSYSREPSKNSAGWLDEELGSVTTERALYHNKSVLGMIQWEDEVAWSRQSLYRYSGIC